MKALTLALVLALAAPPVAAEEAVPPEGDIEEGMSLFEEGAKLILRGLAQEMEPAMQDMAEGMQDFAANLEPMLRELARMMGDLSAYHLPERLPNGDIIIRRKRPGEHEFGPGGETEI
jgi:hypothetical protein